MKYIRRSVKYFIQLTLIFTVLIAILMLSGMVEKDVAVAFRRGWDSVWMILGVFAAMAALYPRFGYTTRKVSVKGEPSELWPGIEEVMTGRGYESAGETPDGGRRYHLRSSVNRAARLWEDTITLTPVLGGFQAEGLARDLARVISSIDHKFNRYE